MITGGEPLAQKNIINELKDENGKLHSEKEQLIQITDNFYNKL